MLLAVDIGNTNITFGIFKGDRIIKSFNLPTRVYNFSKLRQRIKGIKIEDAILCSVVPSAAKTVSKDLNRLLGKEPFVLGKNISVPIKNLYRYPKQVGQDRLVNAYAGVMLFSAPLIVVDFGTAITFDVISREREYMGGMILPGLRISLNALFQYTALLPKVNLNSPREFIGRGTAQSMLSGLVYGFCELTDGLIEKIRSKIGKNARSIGTGGDIALVSKYCSGIDQIEANLTLKGLEFIFQSHSRAGSYKK